MKKTLKSLLTAFVVGLLAGPQFVVKGYAAASGNYTDLLPIGAAGDTTVISRGSGWAITTLAPASTFGDSLSRAPYTSYQSTTAVNVSASVALTTFTAISGQGKVGYTTFPTNWVASGRSFRITARGHYSTIAGMQSWIWGLNIGTMTVVSSSQAVTSSVSSAPFSVSGIFTIAATGSAGSINANYDISASTAIRTVGSANVSNLISYSTSSANAVTVDLNSQTTLNPFFQWGASSQGNNIQFNNVIVEFLN